MGTIAAEIALPAKRSRFSRMRMCECEFEPSIESEPSRPPAYKVREERDGAEGEPAAATSAPLTSADTYHI